MAVQTGAGNHEGAVVTLRRSCNQPLNALELLPTVARQVAGALVDRHASGPGAFRQGRSGDRRTACAWLRRTGTAGTGRRLPPQALPGDAWDFAELGLDARDVQAVGMDVSAGALDRWRLRYGLCDDCEGSAGAREARWIPPVAPPPPPASPAPAGRARLPRLYRPVSPLRRHPERSDENCGDNW